MRKALVVGINHYDHLQNLFGCVNDAESVNGVLERDADGSVNFSVKVIKSAVKEDKVSLSLLRGAIKELFTGDSEIALFYFAGHGYIEDTGGYLCSSDYCADNGGIALSEVMTWANKSAAKNKVIILDSCQGGIAGQSPLSPTSELSDGVTILTASTAEQYAVEIAGSGVFTNLLVDALNGAAANLVGDVTPGSVYAHIDQSLGPWCQRPVFKTNVKSFVSLRKVEPPLRLQDLRRITEFFPTEGCKYSLDPSYEPERRPGDEQGAGYVPPDPINNEKFSLLQKYNRVNLLVPNNAKHMFHAAMESESCSLTALGEHYRVLVSKKMI